MQDKSLKIKSIRNDIEPGEPLAPWTYLNTELFVLEYEALFLKRWQFVGHVNDVTDVGDYITADIGRDNVVVLRGKDQELRAFLNVCRHRASRVLEGAGTCRGVIRCPYHGWTFNGDGSCVRLPSLGPDAKIPDRTRVDAYPVEEKYGLVWTFLGDLPEAERPPIIDIPEYDDPKWRSILLRVDWKIDYKRALENPQLRVTNAGETKDYLAVPIAAPGDEHDRLVREHPHPVWFRFLTGYPPRRFLRLEVR